MKKPRISLIAVISERKRAIGYKNGLIWNLPEDLKRFKKITENHPVIMGYKTFQSLKKPLVNRLNIVITSKERQIPDCLVAHTIVEALKFATQQDKQEVFIIGGEGVFGQTIDLADRLYLTIVKDQPVADKFFPSYNKFRKILYEENKKEGDLEYRFVVLER